MQHLKSNFFNVLVPVEEEHEWLLYNTLTGGMEVLQEEQGAFLAALIARSMTVTLDEVMESVFLSYLYEREYLSDISEPERDAFARNYRAKKLQLVEREVGDIGLTIGTTITCNMGCPYCFEFEKPNKSLRDEENMQAIIEYLWDMIKKAPVNKWRRCMVVWYGGEPLINAGAIEKLTPRLLEFCEANGIEYKSNIVTNGLLLTPATWEMLRRNRVTELQITIDGAEEQHNKKRPLKAARGENYKKILSNIANKPDELEVTVRINVDKDVAEHWDEFFDDMFNYGIWPQHYDTVTFSPSWLRPYEEVKDNAASNYLTNPEFFDVMQDFRMRKLRRFNSWAEKNNLQKAKLRWELPTLQEDCATWTSPYNIVIDPEGYVQKCWETIHDSSNHIHHVSEGYKPETFLEYSAYDKIDLNEICKHCQYIPVCDKLPCSKDAIKHGKPECTYWKTKLPDSLRDQYLLMKQHPELIIPPAIEGNANTGHSNK